MDISWINTKVGFQMAEVIRKYLPRLTKALQDIAVYHTEIKSDDPGKLLYDNDINQIVDAIDIRKQENINLKFQLDETKAKLSKLDEQHLHYLDLTNGRLNALETMLKGYEPQYKDRLNKIDQKWYTSIGILKDKINKIKAKFSKLEMDSALDLDSINTRFTRLETIIEERK